MDMPADYSYTSYTYAPITLNKVYNEIDFTYSNNIDFQFNNSIDVKKFSPKFVSIVPRVKKIKINAGETLEQYHLAQRYNKGNMLKKNKRNAAFWSQKAAFSGDKKAQALLDEIIKKKK